MTRGLLDPKITNMEGGLNEGYSNVKAVVGPCVRISRRIDPIVSDAGVRINGVPTHKFMLRINLRTLGEETFRTSADVGPVATAPAIIQ